MFLKKAKDNVCDTIYLNRAVILEVIIGISAIVTITAFFYINPVMEFVVNYVKSAGF